MRSHAEIVSEQRALWAACPRDWADIAEGVNWPLYDAMLNAAALDHTKSLLDVACGSGYLLEEATKRGARTAGVDVTPELLAIAAERAPDCDLREEDMCALSFETASFDVVTSANGFQFAPDPAKAIAEAARVLKTGGLMVAAVFAEPEHNEGTALHLAMKDLVDDEPDGYAPYALSIADGLRLGLEDAGLELETIESVPVAWQYASTEMALRALYASAGGARSVRAVGRDRVREALLEPLKQFTASDGTVKMNNLFRYAIGRKP